jgi:hypothetical protein
VGEKIARHRDAADDRFGETTGSEFVGHFGDDLLPQVAAEFFMDALVADDGKLLRPGRKIKQDRVAILSGAHPELLETARRAIDDVTGLNLTSGDKDTDFAGRPAFRLLNRLSNRGFVQLAKEIMRFHGCTTISRWPRHHRSFRRHR